MNQSLDKFFAAQDHFVASLNNTYNNLLTHSETLTKIYLVALFSALIAYTFLTPIEITDTDLWYHLNGGRYFWETGTVSSHTFFSFIEPEKYRTNYFWGFQALSYKIYELSGYQGLIVFKTLLVTISAFFISIIIIGNKPINKSTALQLAIVALVVFILSQRTNYVRPHLISYTIVPVFIYVLLHKPKYTFTLPFLTVIWVNCHGVEWPVGALICGAFFISYIGSYLKNKNKEHIKQSLWVLSCLPALLINPYGYDILLAPFGIDPDAYLYISELKETPIFTSALLTKYFSLTPRGAIFVLFIFYIYSIISLWLKRKLCFTQLLIAAGALVLLFRGYRFIWEWLLLSTPLLWLSLSHINLNPFKKRLITKSAILALILITPFTLWANKSFKYNNYPYDYTQTPTPTTELVKKLDIKGRYLAPASISGYIQWELYPDLLVHSDMEFPPFDAVDFAEAFKAMVTEAGFKNATTRYNPDLFGVYRKASQFSEFINNFPNYVLISVDDHLALYINKESHPELAEKYQLKHIDPFDLNSGINSENREQFTRELQQLVDINPYSHSILIALISYQILDKQYDEALRHARLLKKLYPRNANADFLEGQVHEKMGNHEKAVEAYKLVLDSDDKKLKKTIHSYLADSYYELEDYDNAYDEYKISFNSYIRVEKIKSYYKYGYSALLVGDVKKAKRIFTLMLLVDDGKHEETINKAKALLQGIEENKFKQEFFI